MTRVLIIGFGHIGQSTINYLKDCDIWTKDKDDKITNISTGETLSELAQVKADYWIICVPGEKDGNIDTTLVNKYVQKAIDAGVEPIVRTTLPLYYEKQITYWPSFVTDYDTEEQSGLFRKCTSRNQCYFFR